jgi:hypothetical protein
VPSGLAIPQANITVFLNTAVTSRILGGQNQSEALLLIDEPGGIGGTPFPCPSPLGCPAISTGGPGQFDGAPGHHNIFQGTVTGVNSVTFLGVPMAPPEPLSVRTFRITNLRANAAGLPVDQCFSPHSSAGGVIRSGTRQFGGDVHG